MVLKPQIPLIFSTFFQLMDEIGNEEVISTLQALLGQVGEDVEPYAAEVVTRLTTMCLTLLDAPEDDDESRLAAAEALRTISAVFYAFGPKPAVITGVEGAHVPAARERVVLSEGDGAPRTLRTGWSSSTASSTTRRTSVERSCGRMFPRIVKAPSPRMPATTCSRSPPSPTCSPRTAGRRSSSLGSRIMVDG